MLQTDDDSNCKPEKSKLKYFSTTYKQIPNLLPQRTADNLSVPLAFAAILQLANENNLVLQQIYGNLGDFVILNPKKIGFWFKKDHLRLRPSKISMTNDEFDSEINKTVENVENIF